MKRKTSCCDDGFMGKNFENDMSKTHLQFSYNDRNLRDIEVVLICKLHITIHT